MATLRIGIDPDCDKNGVAILMEANGQKQLQLQSMRFFELFEYLKANKESIKLVIVEAGWLVNKSNFHNEKSGSQVASRIGKNTGSNHETGRKIVEMLEFLKIDHRITKPLKKIWKGRDRKITHQELVRLTGIPAKRSNQEERDAALLVWR